MKGRADAPRFVKVRAVQIHVGHQLVCLILLLLGDFNAVSMWCVCVYVCCVCACVCAREGSGIGERACFVACMQVAGRGEKGSPLGKRAELEGAQVLCKGTLHKVQAVIVGLAGCAGFGVIERACAPCTCAHKRKHTYTEREREREREM